MLRYIEKISYSARDSQGSETFKIKVESRLSHPFHNYYIGAIHKSRISQNHKLVIVATIPDVREKRISNLVIHVKTHNLARRVNLERARVKEIDVTLKLVIEKK